MQLHKLVWKRVTEDRFTQRDFYTSKGLHSAVSNKYSGLKHFVEQHNDEYEVVTYELVEVKRQSLYDFMQE